MLSIMTFMRTNLSLLCGSDMLKLLSITIFVTLLTCDHAMALRGRGGSHGGGGNICFIDNRAVILDLVRNNLPHSNFEPGVQIPTSFQELGLFNPFISDQGILLKSKISQMLQPFIKKFPELGQILFFGIENMWFFGTHNRFAESIQADFSNTQLCHTGNVRAVVGFYAGLKFISIPDWNQLDLDTQAHLIIHEGWRFYQSYSDSQLFQTMEAEQDLVTNAELQELTYASIVDVDVILKTNLANKYFTSVGLSVEFRNFSCAKLKYPVFKSLPSDIKMVFEVACNHPFSFDRNMKQTAKQNINSIFSSYSFSKNDSIRQKNRPRYSLEQIQELENLLDFLAVDSSLWAAAQINGAAGKFQMNLIDLLIRSPRNYSDSTARQELSKILHGFPIQQLK